MCNAANIGRDDVMGTSSSVAGSTGNDADPHGCAVAGECTGRRSNGRVERSVYRVRIDSPDPHQSVSHHGRFDRVLGRDVGVREIAAATSLMVGIADRINSARRSDQNLGNLSAQVALVLLGYLRHDPLVGQCAFDKDDPPIGVMTYASAVIGWTNNIETDRCVHRKTLCRKTRCRPQRPVPVALAQMTIVFQRFTNCARSASE